MSPFADFVILSLSKDRLVIPSTLRPSCSSVRLWTLRLPISRRQAERSPDNYTGW